MPQTYNAPRHPHRRPPGRRAPPPPPDNRPRRRSAFEIFHRATAESAVPAPAPPVDELQLLAERHEVEYVPGPPIRTKAGDRCVRTVTVPIDWTKGPQPGCNIPTPRSNEARRPSWSVVSTAESERRPIWQTFKVYPFFCTCDPLEHCGKVATIHPTGCDICTGEVTCPELDVHRIYPVDRGWLLMREMVKACRDATGLPQIATPENEVFWTDYRRERLGHTHPLHRPEMDRYNAFYPPVDDVRKD